MDLRAWFLEALAAEGTPPLRLHEGVAADGAPDWSHGFAAWLARSPADLDTTVEATDCPHPLTLGRAAYCQLCGGSGAATATVRRWRYPLWRALRSLRGSARGRRHLATLAAIAEGRPVPDEAAVAALRSLRARWRR